MTVSIKPLVRIAMHDVKSAPWSVSGNLLSAEEKPLQVPVLPRPAHQLDVFMIPIATGVKVRVLPIVDKVKPVCGVPCHALQMPHCMRTWIVIQIDVVTICAHVLLVVCLEKMVRRRVSPAH